MSRRSLTYADAVRLIGDPESPAITTLGRLGGAGAGVVTAVSVGTIDFFALRDELVRWGHTAVAGLREKLGGLSRFDRTERLVAAHGVLVVTSFFEALDEGLSNLGVDLEAAELTAAEQVALATGDGPARNYAGLIVSFLETPLPIPSPAHPAEAVAEELAAYYRGLADDLIRFLLRLAAFEGRQQALDLTLETGLVDRAVARYTAAYRALAAEAPEFRVWAAGVDASATREAVRSSGDVLRADLAELRALVTRPTAADAVRTGLERLHRAQLDRPILATDRVPEHVTLPRLHQSYVDPGGAVAEAGPDDRPATETWWHGAHPVDDVPDFLAAHLTTLAASSAPTVVLGHPGSGKSALAKVLAARLTGNGFLAIRVQLRTVPGDASIQTQIEQALLQSLGESVSWPDVARRAEPALPVVVLDGFDELLQATGLNRSDYLEQAQAFQEREAELGRPVAVLVTSRTVVADRVRFPLGSVVVRLAPFDSFRVGRWLDTWNTVNRASLAERGLRPLPVEVALTHGELARQPLLLLLLALYDAGANALQAAGGDLGQVELYERLFADFVDREVDKRRDGRSAEDRQAEIAREWRRLGAVALAVLNRRGDVILDAELDRDLPQLLGGDDLTAGNSDPRGHALTASQLLVGRFFFVHEATATRDTGAPERSFEFLHATFGDFLAARLIVDALVDLADARAYQRRRFRAELDGGFLFAATSFVTVARRAPLWDFVRGRIAALAPEVRRSCRELVLELLPEAGFPPRTWSVADYEPRREPFAARHAAFSANLVCFAVLLAEGPVRADELAGGSSPVAWRQLSLLWRSQLDLVDRGRLWRVFRVAWHFEDDPAWLEVRLEDGSDVSVYESLPWPTDGRLVGGSEWVIPDVRVPADSEPGEMLRRAAFVQTTVDMRETVYGVMPAWPLAGSSRMNFSPDAPVLLDSAGIVQQVVLVPPERFDHEIRRHLVQKALMTGHGRYRRAVLHALADEPATLRGSGFRDYLGILHPGTFAEDLPLLARIIAASCADPSGAGTAKNLIATWSDVLADHAISWPDGAEQTFRLAFDGAGLTWPPWLRTFFES
ncbi:NACHT domain-containing protein [Cryptosporangium sp. NPDC051539]|uniref:NACHT domain-containing protein n=1 Tax=Cryptosporangium sp. NPDC051539 TaxID=3363962 RepID=UPI00379A3122